MNHEEECRRKRKLKWEKEGEKKREKCGKEKKEGEWGREREKAKGNVNGQGGGRVEKGEYEMSIKRYLEG